MRRVQEILVWILTATPTVKLNPDLKKTDDNRRSHTDFPLRSATAETEAMALARLVCLVSLLHVDVILSQTGKDVRLNP